MFDRRQWFEAHLRCTHCGGAPLQFDTAGARCPSCGAGFPRRGEAWDFLDKDTRSAFGVVDTDNVSDHPFDENARELIDQVGAKGGMILDCGAGYKAESFPHVVQLEIVAYPLVDVLAVNQALPFADESFDAVFSLDVLEHVDDPFSCAREIVRVLKPGGVLYIDLPFLQAEHGYPHHYFNATRAGLQRLFWGQLEVADHYVPLSGHPIFVLHQVLGHYLPNLPEDVRARFADISLGDLLARPVLDWLRDPAVTELPEAARWVIAASTQARLVKRRAAEGLLFAAEPAGAEKLSSSSSVALATSRLMAENAALAGRVDELQSEVVAMRGSTSWRLTAPLRRLMASWRSLLL